MKLNSFVQIAAVVCVGALLICCGAAEAGTTQYQYDALGRLVEVIFPDGVIVTYAYDQAGNRTSKVVSTNSGNSWGGFSWGQAQW